MPDYSHNIRRRILAEDMPSWIAKHPRRQYLVRLILATPYWVDKRALRDIRKEAKRRSVRDGHRYAADHLVPITHAEVCGLNVPWNLRIISYSENARRSNRWWEWTADLFAEPEQLTLRLVGCLDE